VPRLSVIMPVLDEGEGIVHTLDALAPFRALGVEVVVVDGGSRDATVQRARLRADKVVQSPRGRAVQMNAGAEKASGDMLLFLHPDTRLPNEAERLVMDGLEKSGRSWGRFNVRIAGRSRLLPIVALMINLRSRLTGIATGDQAIFVKRDTFKAVGGYPAIALMEDVALSKRLKRVSRPLCLSARASTSGQRWDRNGVFATIWLMWRLRWAFYFGADPAELAKDYEQATQ